MYINCSECITFTKTIHETFFYFLSIRILPHQQDTGGFFVAVIEKLRPLPWEAAAKAWPTESEEGGQDDSQKDAVVSTSEDKVPWGPQRKRRRIHGYKEDPFVFFAEDEPLWPSIRYPCCWQCTVSFALDSRSESDITDGGRK